jgi:hypothetical protein
MGRTLKIAAATALITALAPFAPVAEAAGTVTVSGTAPQGYSVLMVAKSGNSIASKGGKFKIKTTTATAKAEAKFEVGMNVGVPPKQWWYSRVLIVIPITFAVGLALWLPTSAGRRRRRMA